MQIDIGFKLVFSALLFMLSYPIFTDTILLYGGDEIDGKITKQNVFFVEIESSSGEVYRIRKERIRKISFRTENSITYQKPSISQEIPLAPHDSEETREVAIKTKPETKPKENPAKVMIYEIIQDGKIYLIDVAGEGFLGKLKVSLVSADSNFIQQQKIRDIKENSFLLCVDSSSLSTGEYDLLIEINDGEKEYRLGRYINVISKGNSSLKN
jgi:hypothetical protein